MKLDLKNIKAAIFDMDGTMVSNMEYHKNAWIEFAKEYGINLTAEDFKKKLSGRRNKETFEILFNKTLSKDAIEKYTEEKEALYRQIYAPFIKEVAGLTNILQKFKSKGIRLAIGTTAPLKNRIFVLDNLKLNKVFEVILGEEHVKNGKPDPEIYLKVAQDLGVNPNECLVFEDTPFGIKAGKNAGMKVIGVLTRHTKEELKDADATITDFNELDL